MKVWRTEATDLLVFMVVNLLVRRVKDIPICLYPVHHRVTSLVSNQWGVCVRRHDERETGVVHPAFCCV